MRYECFDDFEAFAASVQNVESRMMYHNAAQRLWRTVSVNVGDVILQRGELGSGNIAQGQMNPAVCMVYVPLTPTAEYRVNGTRVAESCCAILPPGQEFCVSTKVAHDWAALSVPADDVVQAGERLVADTQVTPVPHRTMARLRAVLTDVFTTAAMCPQFEPSPAGQCAASELRRLAGSVLGRRPANGMPAGARVRLPRPQIVRRCLELLEEGDTQPVRVSNLVAVANVSERTLRTAFHEYFGVGPHRYMQLRQLHRAHDALLDAEPDAQSVSSVLVECGVWEFGRFASRYRQHFGEVPSATLRRKKAMARTSVPG